MSRALGALTRGCRFLASGRVVEPRTPRGSSLGNSGPGGTLRAPEGYDRSSNMRRPPRRCERPGAWPTRLERIDVYDATPASVQDLAHWQHLVPCVPWRGHPEWFQYEARVANEITRAHCWLAVTCTTPMCLSHVRVMHPVELDYLRGICVYCGLDADTEDHLLPKGWSGDTSRSQVLTVPACRECNSAIGAQWAPTITERREIAHESIRRRNRKVLVGAALTPTDLAELGPNLRSYVEASLVVKRAVEARLAWPPPLYDVQAMQRSEIDDPEAAGLL